MSKIGRNLIVVIVIIGVLAIGYLVLELSMEGHNQRDRQQEMMGQAQPAASTVFVKSPSSHVG